MEQSKKQIVSALWNFMRNYLRIWRSSSFCLDSMLRVSNLTTRVLVQLLSTKKGLNLAISKLTWENLLFIKLESLRDDRHS